jgi:hypothetical protein
MSRYPRTGDHLGTGAPEQIQHWPVPRTPLLLQAALAAAVIGGCVALYPPDGPAWWIIRAAVIGPQAAIYLLRWRHGLWLVPGRPGPADAIVVVRNFLRTYPIPAWTVDEVEASNDGLELRLVDGRVITARALTLGEQCKRYYPRYRQQEALAAVSEAVDEARAARPTAFAATPIGNHRGWLAAGLLCAGPAGFLALLVIQLNVRTRLADDPAFAGLPFLLAMLTVVAVVNLGPGVVRDLRRRTTNQWGARGSNPEPTD